MFRTGGFIFRKKAVCTRCVYVHQYKQTYRYKIVWVMLNTLYLPCTYNPLPEDEPPVSKHVEDISEKLKCYFLSRPTNSQHV